MKGNGSEIIDVAIIGAGPSGTYSAYRLITADATKNEVLSTLLEKRGGEKLRIALYEYSNRIGGRLWTYDWSPDLDRLKKHRTYAPDLGGKAFSILHQNVFGLCQELRIALREFTPYTQSQIQYLRNQRFPYADYTTNPEVVPYDLRKDQRGLVPQDVFDQAVQEVVPGFKQAYDAALAVVAKVDPRHPDFEPVNRAILAFTLFLRNAKAKFEGDLVSLTRYGLWNVLLPQMGNEAFSLVSDASFAHSYFWNFNLYDQLAVNYIFGLVYAIQEAGPKFLTPSDGYQTLPLTLAQRFSDNGGEVCMGHRLISIHTDSHEGEQVSRLIMQTESSEMKVVLARYVIMALPQYALKNLSSDSVLYKSPVFCAHVNNVTAIPASSIIAAFDNAWWYKKPGDPKSGFLQGMSITDYPMRACYYLGVDPDGRGLLNPSLADATATQYWAGLNHGRHFETGLPLHPHNSRLTQGDAAITPELLQETCRQLQLLHGPDYQVQPAIGGAFANWAQKPFGGGWHYWNPDQKSWEIMPKIRQPIPDANIYICGETFSATQGWTEGALNTAEKVMQDGFGLPRPRWVVDNYDFGP